MTIQERVRANVKRVAALLEGGDGSRAIPGMEWTVGEAAAHLVTGAREYRAYFEGRASDVERVDQVAGVNQSYLADYPERDPSRIAGDLSPAFEDLLRAYDAAGPDAMLSWHVGSKVRAGDALGVILGELLVHGWDIAQGLGRPWAIEPDDAVTVLLASLSIAPLYVDKTKSAGMNGAIRARLRGGPTIGLYWKDGELSTGDEPGKADCTISADPVAFLLTSYGRGSKWKPILTGKVVAYGRNPMLALKFQKVLISP